jgi:hypothetical protein
VSGSSGSRRSSSKNSVVDVMPLLLLHLLQVSACVHSASCIQLPSQDDFTIVSCSCVVTAAVFLPAVSLLQVPAW